MFYSQNIEWHISQAIDIHLSLSIYNTRMMKIFTFLKQKMLAMKACFILSYKINNQKHNKKKIPQSGIKSRSYMAQQT